MNGAVMVAAVNTLAEWNGAKHRYLAWCTCCVNELDPKWELPAMLAPLETPCFACGNPEREAEGMCLVLVPETHPAVCRPVAA